MSEAALSLPADGASTMVALAQNVQEQLNRLGFSPEDFGAQLDGVNASRLKALTSPLEGGLPIDNRFMAKIRDGRAKMAKAFSNPNPKQAMAALKPFIEGTYGNNKGPDHPSAENPIKFLMHRRRRAAVKMTRAMGQNDDLRNRVSTQLNAFVASDGRSDGVISVQRRPAQEQPQGHNVANPPAQSYNTIWEIMLAMDEAILNEATRLGVGASDSNGPFASGSGDPSHDTVGYLEAMGLWSLKPDAEFDPEAWAGMFKSDASGGNTTTSSRLTDVSSGSAANVTEASNQNSGLDVDIMKLKRQIDKKTQMMELYSQTLTKYNSSANAIIQNMKA